MNVIQRFEDWKQHPFVRHPLVRRITGYSAGSVVAIILSEACFAAVLGPGHAGTTLASAAGFVGGAIPNYILNRRWAWRDRRGRARHSEVTLYMVVSLASFLVSAVVTHIAEEGARHLVASRSAQVALTAVAFLAVSAVFFVIKFLIYETVVFKKHAPTTEALSESTPADVAGLDLVGSDLAETMTLEPAPTQHYVNGHNGPVHRVPTSGGEPNYLRAVAKERAETFGVGPDAILRAASEED